MPKTPPNLMRHTSLTISEMDCADRCMYEHFLAYVYRLRSASQARSLRMGSAVHEVLDVVAKEKQRDQFPSAELINKTIEGMYREAMSKAATQDDIDDLFLEMTYVSVLVEGYLWYWSNEDKDAIVVASEHQFKVPIINPETGAALRIFDATGKMDRIIERRGRLVLQETKTTSKDISPGSQYRMKTRLNTQVTVYFEAGKIHEGRELDAIEYDMLRIPGVGPAMLTQKRTARLIETGEYVDEIDDVETILSLHKVESFTRDAGEQVVLVDGTPAEVTPGKKGFAIRETLPMLRGRILQDIYRRPEYYFQRDEIPRTAEDILEGQFDRMCKAQEIRLSDRLGRHPRSPQACTGMRTCPYLKLCANRWEPSAYENIQPHDIPDGFVIVDSPHTELAED